MIVVFRSDYSPRRLSLASSKETVTSAAPNDDATPLSPGVLTGHPGSAGQNTLFSLVQLLPFPILLLPPKAFAAESFLAGDVAIKGKRYKWEV